MFESKEAQLSSRVVHQRLFRNQEPLSFRQVVELWQTSDEFCSWYSNLLGQSAFEAFRWETPVVTEDLFDRDFEFVLVDTPSFASRATDQHSFAEHFERADPETQVLSFPNLRGDSLMIVPAPVDPPTTYGHLVAFLRNAPAGQQRLLWNQVGQSMLERVGDKPVWLSTAGGGVAWLHVRLDSRPKYYHYQPYRDERPGR